jgi:hypothetical protein
MLRESALHDCHKNNINPIPTTTMATKTTMPIANVHGSVMAV